MKQDGIHVAIVGLGFGEAFVPIYQAHPRVRAVTLCDPDEARRREVGTRYGLESGYARLEDALSDPDVDAVHLLSPVPFHVDQTLATLGSGKHCACAVPMATDVDGARRVFQAARASGRVYMMMETMVYGRECLFAQDMVRRGEIGAISLLRADYHQDLEAPYPDYWRRVPPMHYATHAVAPLLALAGCRAAKVSCLGGGRLRPDICDDPRNPFPLQSALFRLDGSDAVATVNRSWYQTAHDYVEAFSVYGDRAGFEWQQLEHEDPVVFRLEPVQSVHRFRGAPGTRVPVPFRPDLLPPESARFADGGHGGSHPHLVHEFVSAIVEGRPSRIDEGVAADWTLPGICAHESSLRDGEWVEVPDFRR